MGCDFGGFYKSCWNCAKADIKGKSNVTGIPEARTASPCEIYRATSRPIRFVQRIRLVVIDITFQERIDSRALLIKVQVGLGQVKLAYWNQLQRSGKDIWTSPRISPRQKSGDVQHRRTWWHFVFLVLLVTYIQKFRSVSSQSGSTS